MIGANVLSNFVVLLVSELGFVVFDGAFGFGNVQQQ
jgi:hypothetical protein